MSMQLAKLYLRGSLVNVTMKNLSEQEQQMVENKFQEFMNNQQLASCKQKFCSVLYRTIGGEYQDHLVALNDYYVALFRALVYIMFHKPNEQIFQDNTQIIKLLKNFIYEYMKQILNENKIPHDTRPFLISGNPLKVAAEHIKHILNDNIISITKRPNNYIIEHTIISNKQNKKLLALQTKYKKYDIKIHINDGVIVVDRIKQSKSSISVKLNKKIKLHIHDITTCRNDKYDQLEYEIHQKHNNMATDESFTACSFIPDDIKPLIHFTHTSMTKSFIARKLNINLTEAERRLSKFKIYYYCHESGMMPKTLSDC